MTKEDKLQLIKWIILCALSFLFCAYGFILRLNGYGKTGAIMQDLNKVIKEPERQVQLDRRRRNVGRLPERSFPRASGGYGRL